MSYSNLNGVWRNTVPMSNLNGVWRQNNDWTNINGVWRNSHTPTAISSEDIEYFEIVYVRSLSVRYFDYPWLQNNPDIPAKIHIAGYTPNEEVNLNPKSIVLEYTNDNPSTEGLCVYTGSVYAVLHNGKSFNASSICDGVVDNISEFNIRIYGYSTYESYGPNVIGWNRMFENSDNLPEIFHDDKNTLPKNSYPILPTQNRPLSYDFNAMIGIARNMSSRFINMVGSHGLLDHTYDSITLNGTDMPFKITIYE